MTNQESECYGGSELRPKTVLTLRIAGPSRIDERNGDLSTNMIRVPGLRVADQSRLLLARVFKQEFYRLGHSASPKHRTMVRVGFDDEQHSWMIDVCAL
jgi:hypothetical protein